MTKSERAAFIDRRLAQLYPDPPIPLDHVDSFTLLVAVLLSAQCTDVRVNLTTPALFARASTPEAMMLVPVEEIEAIIRPCGLAPAKAKGISGLSRILVERHGGRLVKRFDLLGFDALLAVFLFGDQLVQAPFFRIGPHEVGGVKLALRAVSQRGDVAESGLKIQQHLAIVGVVER